MSVKMSGTLPNDFDRNGLDVLHSQLVAHPDRRHVVVMVVDTIRTTIEHGGEDERYTPTVGALYIEPIQDRDDVVAVSEIMSRARATRTGDATLDFDFGVEDPLAKVAQRLKDEGVSVSVRKGGES
ncbi:MAG TPA: hypothetical protein VN133_13725 [Humibacter sp.]|nr:hypothetical protein [Humibacter sp.]